MRAPELSAEELQRVAREIAGQSAYPDAAVAALRGGVPAGVSSSLLARMPAAPVVTQILNATASTSKPRKTTLRGAGVFSRGGNPLAANESANSFKLPELTAPSRSDALLVAAQTVETFGTELLAKFNDARAEQARKKGRTAPPVPEVRFGADLRSADVLEPFILVVLVRFGAAPADTLLRLHYQFDTSFRGYIVGVSEKQGGAREKSHLTTARPPQPGDAPLPAGQYSMQHVPSAQNLMDEVDAGQGNWDAMTKVAGEAARFRCVRDAAQARQLTDDLVFHDGTNGIRFRDLWLTWVEFGNKYGITDGEIRAKLAEWAAIVPSTRPWNDMTQDEKKGKKLHDAIVPAGVGGHALG